MCFVTASADGKAAAEELPQEVLPRACCADVAAAVRVWEERWSDREEPSMLADVPCTGSLSCACYNPAMQVPCCLVQGRDVCSIMGAPL